MDQKLDQGFGQKKDNKDYRDVLGFRAIRTP